MDKKVSKSLILGVIVLFLGASFTPIINAELIQQNEILKSYKDTDQNNTAYFYCFIEINGTGNFTWVPPFGTIFGVDGSVSIKGLFSMDIITRKIIKLNDGCSVNGQYMVIAMWFIGTKSVNDDGNLVARGFAFCAAAPHNPS